MEVFQPMLIKYGVSQLQQSLLLVMFIYLVSPFSVTQSFLVALNHRLLRTFIFHPNAPHIF